ncbi:hypothetical protein P8452_65031 [Trifolium repens]|nr:hypothetical protein P8452_65031 [Trifolium repens]
MIKISGKILYCALISGRHVLPIFYDVDPSEVRHQKGRYGKAFEKHKERLKHDLEVVRRWRTALTRVANITGWDLRHKRQYAEIEKIAKQIMDSLGPILRESPNKDIIDVLQSKYQYPLRPTMYHYNGCCRDQTKCTTVEVHPRGDYHHYMEQRYIQGYPVQPSRLSYLNPFGHEFNSGLLMFNDENPNSCSIM